MKLFDLPAEIVAEVLQHTVVVVKFHRALRLRLVCSKTYVSFGEYSSLTQSAEDFDAEVQHAIFATRFNEYFPWHDIRPESGANSMLSRYYESRCLADSRNSNQFTGVIRRAAETLAFGIDLDTQYTWGTNVYALCQATTIHCDPIEIRRLLDSKEDRSSACNSNESRTDEMAVFVGAAYTGNIAKVREMLASSRDVQHKSRFIVPLQCACSGGYKDIVRLLLEHGADINCGHPWTFSSPLHSACLGGQEDIVRLLLEPKYEISISKYGFHIAALGAARGGHLNIVMLLQEKALGMIETDLLLSEASKYGQKDFVRKVLDNEAFSIPRLESALTCSLQEAANRGYHQVVRLLLAHGANGEDGSLWGPFKAASRNGYERVVRVLLEHRADTEKWPRILIPAASHGQAHIVAFLLESRVDVDLKSWSYQAVRALKVATKEGYESVVRMLVDHGVNLESVQ